MSDPVLRVPGLYVREKREFPKPALPTGVPAFIGFMDADAIVPDGAPMTGNLYGPVRLHRKSDFPGGALAYLEHAVTGFFDNGGVYCYIVGVKSDPAAGVAAAMALKNGLELINSLTDIDLVAIPDAVALRSDGSNTDLALVCDVQGAVIEHCDKEGNRIALLDSVKAGDLALLEPLTDSVEKRLIKEQVERLGVLPTGPSNAALYHPWIRIRTDDNTWEFVPPCGHVAGIIARTDAQVGVFKPPANAEVQGAADIDDRGGQDLKTDDVASLNDRGVNCLRVIPGRGIRVWGARTLSSDPQWRFINVRRLVLTVGRWIEMNMAWAPFEPHVPTLWVRIRRELSGYLTQLWRSGALKGDSAAEAFYVRCDGDLNPAASREAGLVVTEIGLAPTLPAEFIVVTLHHRAGTTELI